MANRAPRARRIPIFGVRCVAACAFTPSRPNTASTNARAPKSPTSVTIWDDFRDWLICAA
jgi:hypothetical protein